MKISSPLRGRYLVKNSYLYLILKFIDFITSFFTLIKRKRIIKKPKKILIANIAHLGDAVIATSVLPVIKKKFPDAKIGFLCSSDSKELLDGHHMIDKIYSLDHWKLNRSGCSLFKKIIFYFKNRSRVIKEIKKENYDVAIDLYSYFPNAIYTLWKTKIKYIIAYSSAGFENFLNNKLDWVNQNKHISSYHFELIKFLNIGHKESNILKMSLPISRKTKNQIELPQNFILFHVGAGDLKKMWDVNKWKQLTKIMLEKGKTIVFTGKGIYESQQIYEIIDGHKKCINLCDKLSLKDVVLVVSKAKFVVCVDSLILHIATVLNVPTAIIYCGINNHHHWVLKRNNVFPIVKNIPCSPCYEKNGCETMDCLNSIHVEDVLSKMENVLEKFN